MPGEFARMAGGNEALVCDAIVTFFQRRASGRNF
jgi:hypothetical protein